jgi:hypothetical protein
MALGCARGPVPDRDAFNQAFFHNLFGYVRDVPRRRAPGRTPSQPDAVRQGRLYAAPLR